jgi:hypothetical protein
MLLQFCMRGKGASVGVAREDGWLHAIGSKGKQMKE